MSAELSLQELVIGYCRQVGALIEPPAYGIYDVLLPDEAAKRWGVDAYQRFTFEQAENLPPGVTLLHYGHPLTEQMVEELRLLSANAQFFINNVRLEKPGLYAVIEKALILPNARLFPVHGALDRRRTYHYLRLNSHS